MQQIAILITDGLSDIADVIPNAKLAAGDGIEIFAIGK